MEIIFQTKKLTIIGNDFIKLSSWKVDSIISLMKLNYKNGTEEVIRNVIQDIYNLTNLSCKYNIFRLINNKSANIMNDESINTSIRICFR